MAKDDKYKSLYDSMLVGTHTNFTPSKTGQLAINAASSVVQNFTGVNVGSALGLSSDTNMFATTPFANLTRLPGIDFGDFRARRGATVQSSILLSRKDGASAAFNKGSGARAKAYAAASLTPAGAYGVFNLEAAGKRGFGWGSHGDPDAKVFKSDFTMQSNIVTKWSTLTDGWVKKIRNVATPFRGDKVNAVDYGKRPLKQAYKWRTSLLNTSVLGGLDPNVTQDFIKFFLTGPSLHNGVGDTVEDDIMVFRATITTLDDSFSPEWSAVKMIGRADPNYHYGGYSRDMSLSFTVYATDRDEVKPIWRKLNALAGYTAPTYDSGSIGLIGPWMRITVGDLLIQQPVIMDSLQLQLMDADTTWEINIEKDPEMKQVPKKIGVTMQLKVITDYLPQKNGHFYSLSRGNAYGPITGTQNWLTDSTNTTQMTVESNQETDRQLGYKLLKDSGLNIPKLL